MGGICDILGAMALAGAVEESEVPQGVVRDDRGAQVGRIEPNPIIRDQYVVKDAQGRRVGTVEPNQVIRGEWVVKDAQGRRTGSVR